MWLVIHSKSGHYWGFPKGHMGDHNEGETLEEAAIREVKEETGVTARIIKKLKNNTRYQYNWQNEQVEKTVWYFLMEYVSGEVEDHDDEVHEALFETEAKVLEVLMYEKDKEIFREAVRLIKE